MATFYMIQRTDTDKPTWFIGLGALAATPLWHMGAARLYTEPNEAAEQTRLLRVSGHAVKMVQAEVGELR